ncbi:MAG: oligosaccharide flippase family protein [Alistipes sp.]|nr:oligosaccharide flippase family protein [Alistipes sp.]
MNKKNSLAKSTFIISIGTFLPKLASFITLPILTGCLTKEQYGTYDIITVLVSLYLPSLTLQLKSAAFRFLLDVREDKEKQKKIITNIFSLTVPISVISLLILFIFLPGASSAVRLWICGYYLADILVNTVRQMARGLGKNLDYSISAIISALGKMIFAVIFVWELKWGLIGGIIALCLACFMSLIYIVFRLKIWKYIDMTLVDKDVTKSMLGYSWPIVPNEMSLWVMNMSDRLIVTNVLGIAVNAVYAAATKIPQLINLAQSALNLAWQECAALTVKDKDSNDYYTEMFDTMLRLQGGVFGVVVGSAPILFKILIKGAYEDAYAHIPILCAGLFFSGMAIYLGGIYLAYKASKSVGLTTIGAAVVNIVVNISLINFIGIYAASISTLVSYICLFIFRSVNIRKLVKIKYNFKTLTIILLIMSVEVIMFYQGTTMFNIINAVFGYSVCLILNKDIIKAMFVTIGKKFKRS